MQTPHFLQFETKKDQIIAKEGRHLLILRSKWNKIKFNVKNFAINRKKLWMRSAIKAQQNLKTLVRNATSAMFKIEKLKRSATFTIAKVALWASNCAFPTSAWYLLWQNGVDVFNEHHCKFYAKGLQSYYTKLSSMYRIELLTKKNFESAAQTKAKQTLCKKVDCMSRLRYCSL